MASLKRLNECVFYREGKANVPKVRENEAPALILVLSWGGAHLKNVRKYTSRYEEIFPEAPLLLVLTEFRHILMHHSNSQDKPLEPVMSIIQNHLGASESQHSRLLVHAFSNGGSYKLVEIARRYHDLTGQAMPIHTIVFDSAPGVASLRRSTIALSHALPQAFYFRLPGQIIIWVFLLFVRSVEALLGREGLMVAMRRRLNERSFINTTKRCYIFSPEDKLVDWRDVQEHAEAARQAGFDTEEEIFKGSQHVAHARLDPDRYWSIIKHQWSRKAASERKPIPNDG